jgi:C4-dicarboxylate transporter DctM subunit
MTGTEIGLIGIATITLLILAGVHIAFALILIGFLGLACIIGPASALSNITLIEFNKVNSYEFAVVPLFLLMSVFVARSGIGKEIYRTACAWVGHLKGGLAMATTAACGLFAACCGSSLATAIAMGQMAYPEMKRYNYDSTLSIGTIAAGGTIGILIPPSIGFIVIGILTELSIGKLFVAGIIPGILEVLFYMGTIHVMCVLNPKLGPALPPTTFSEKIKSLSLTWPALFLFLLVIGGIYGGVFTPTEAGAVGACGALIIGLLRRSISGSDFKECMLESAKIIAMMVALIIGAFIFNQFLALTRIPFVTSKFIVSLGYNRYIILVSIILVYIILGMIFDVFAVLVLTIPIIFPTVVALGFNPIWYAVIMVRVIEVGMITPPFGINLFGLAGTVQVPIENIYKGVIPFLVADFLHIALLIAVPSLVTFLPDIMM